jgi:hypothetical protein
MLYFILTVLLLLSCKDTPNKEGEKTKCMNNESISSLIISLLTEETKINPYFIDLYDNKSIRKIKLASNLEYNFQRLNINGRMIDIVEDSKLNYPRIIIYREKNNCLKGKFEFSHLNYTIIGTYNKVNSVWEIDVNTTIEID